MSTTQVGSTQKFSANWDKIFSGKRVKTKPAKVQKSKRSKKDGAKSGANASAPAAAKTPPKKKAIHAEHPTAELKRSAKKKASAKKHAPAKPKPATRKRKPGPKMMQKELF